MSGSSVPEPTPEHGAHVIVHGRNEAKAHEYVAQYALCYTVSSAVAAPMLTGLLACRAVADMKKTASPNAKVEPMLCDLSVLK